MAPDQQFTVTTTRAFPCPCGGAFAKVLDSRVRRERGGVRRRRECKSCAARITTYELRDTDDELREIDLLRRVAQHLNGLVEVLGWLRKLTGDPNGR
jgi:hypothetical protein